MAQFVILTDSSADLSQEMVQELGVDVLPLSFHIGGETLKDYPDHRDMSYEEFYSKIRAGEMSTTNAVNIAQYQDYLLPMLKSGKDILILSFSSGLSSTYDTARMAVQELKDLFPNRRIALVDTLCASLGQGLLVWYAARMRSEGKSIEEVRSWCEANKLRVAHWFTVDDLMHLKRGGRISAATAVVGTMLKIKPVLHVDNEGHLINMEKARGRKAALDALVQKVVDTAVDPAGQTMFLSHSDCLEDAKYVADRIREKCGTQEFRFNFIGPVIGSHTGCGCVALFFLADKR